MTELNERQRAYLLAALKVDQDSEAYHKGAFGRGHFDESRRPASDWRAMPFGRWNNLGRWEVTALRKACGQVDEGSGSTWAALAARGLVTVGERAVYGLLPEQVMPHVTLTTKGRKVARELAGTPAERQPKGALSRGVWRALAAAYQAGEGGLRSPGGGEYGGISWNIWLALLNHRRKSGLVPLVVEFDGWEAAPLLHHPGHQQRVSFLRLSKEGQAYYCQRWAVNHTLHPDIEAPEPGRNLW